MKFLFLLLVVEILLICLPGRSEAITRAEVIKRAETWLNPPVPYSQSKYKNGWRTDCSGYVSMAWKLNTNYNTRTLVPLTKSIAKNSLMAGDILLNPASHVVIFGKWSNSAKTRYIGYEQAGGSTRKTVRREIPYPYYNGGSGYSPRRYNKIQ